MIDAAQITNKSVQKGPGNWHESGALWGMPEVSIEETFSLLKEQDN